MSEFKRFYDTFKPEHYNIYLDIDRSNKTIAGKTKITGLADQDHISIHQKALKVSSIKLIDEPLSFELDDKMMQLIFNYLKLVKLNSILNILHH